MPNMTEEKKNNSVEAQVEAQHYSKIVLWPVSEEQKYLPVPAEFHFTGKGMSFRIEIAHTIEEKAASFRFMYDIYREKEWGVPHSSG